MSITVIGQITRDTLIFPKSGWRVSECPGGTLYSVVALASLTSEAIRLVCNVGVDLYDSAIRYLKKFGNVDTAGVEKVKIKNFHCYILFASEYGTQYDEGTTVPIRFSQVEPFLNDSSFILISPMTGFDIELRTFCQIRKMASCPIYFDYHMLALCRDRLGNRFVRRRKNWINWCSNCDHLQLNRFEAESLSSSPIGTETEMMRFSTVLLQKGVKSVAITLGSKGSLVCWKEGNETYVKRIEPAPVSAVLDTTGCGDVFAAAFIVNFLQTGSIITSYELANRIAGLKCGLNGFDDFINGLSRALSDLGLSLR